MDFFFSSRRRHARFDCDWSSDVCSSDLGSDQGMWTFPDYSDDRLVLVADLMERHAQDEGLGFIGAAVVVLHAAIEEWVTSYLTRDAHQYCQRYRRSFDTLWR